MFSLLVLTGGLLVYFAFFPIMTTSLTKIFITFTIRVINDALNDSVCRFDILL